MDLSSVMMDLFPRDGGPETPCRWTPVGEIYRGLMNRERRGEFDYNWDTDGRA